MVGDAGLAPAFGKALGPKPSDQLSGPISVFLYMYIILFLASLAGIEPALYDPWSYALSIERQRLYFHYLQIKFGVAARFLPALCTGFSEFTAGACS